MKTRLAAIKEKKRLAAEEKEQHERMEAFYKKYAPDFPYGQMRWFADQKFKTELITDLPEDEAISFYRQGDFTDLCAGPHLMSTKGVGKAFKLLNIAGAYWRGSEKNKMLTRIYATA